MTRLIKMKNCHIAFTLICTLWFCGCDHSAENHEAGSIASRMYHQAESDLPKIDFGASFTNWYDFDDMGATHEALLAMTTEEKKRLENLGLRYNFTDNSMKAIQGLENIEELSLGDNWHMTEKGMLLIGTLPNLKSFYYYAPFQHPPRPQWKTPILTKKVFDEIVKLKNLDHISISSHLLTDDCFEHLHRLPSLNGIYISRDSPLTEKSLEYFSLIKSLAKLQFKAENWNGEGLKYFNNHPDLTYLNLSDSDIDDTGLNHLLELKQLTYLNLSGTKITDAGMAVVVQLLNLETLDLHDTAITKASLVHIKKLTKLKKLRTSYTVDVKVFGAYMQQKKLADEAKKLESN